MAVGDGAGAKGGARGRSGRKPRQERNLIGTAEEIQNRMADSGMLLWDPEKHYPEFKQIKPTSVTGRSITQASVKDLGMKGAGKEAFKFTSGPFKPPKT